MKKILLISLVLILMAATAVPAMAGSGGNNGNGHGNSAGHGYSNGGEKNHGPDKDTEKNKGNSETGQGKFKNQENTKWKFSPFYLQGTIASIDSPSTFTVNVIHANAKVKEFQGGTLSITANESTQIFQITQGGEISGTLSLAPSTSNEDGEGEENGTHGNRILISFDKLEVGQRVAVHGRLVDTIYTARLITVYIGHPVEETP